MTGSHVGHDVKIGDRNTIANNCLLGGHVIIGTGTFLGGELYSISLFIWETFA
ncbi:MAG TPA: hypothetical protein EYG40_01310 [Verrucomicrobia bacterium]|nr:hypothetical protein [Verrucomicrobiales bacterium]HIL53655.1 hypothetical protein [Verrucomicrobiota bacterium]